VEKKHRRPVGGTGLGVANIERARVNLLQRRERGVRARLDLSPEG
jgi:hypothetical protein